MAAPKLTEAEFMELLRSANRYDWCVRNPGLAALFFDEATNRDAHGGNTPTDIQIARHIGERIDEAMLHD